MGKMQWRKSVNTPSSSCKTTSHLRRRTRHIYQRTAEVSLRMLYTAEEKRYLHSA